VDVGKIKIIVIRRELQTTDFYLFFKIKRLSDSKNKQ
jgi:hypothetical protein